MHPSRTTHRTKVNFLKYISCVLAFKVSITSFFVHLLPIYSKKRLKQEFFLLSSLKIQGFSSSFFLAFYCRILEILVFLLQEINSLASHGIFLCLVPILDESLQVWPVKDSDNDPSSDNFQPPPFTEFWSFDCSPAYRWDSQLGSLHGNWRVHCSTSKSSCHFHSCYCDPLFSFVLMLSFLAFSCNVFQ